MPIYRDKTRGCWVFEFDRRVAGQPIRVVKRLPKAWNHAQATAYDIKTTGQLYAAATGAGGADPLVEDAVALYLQHRVPGLKHGIDVAHALAIILPFYQGRPFSALADISKAIQLRHRAEDGSPLAPATVKNRIAYLRSAVNYAWKHHSIGGDARPTDRMTVPQVHNASSAFYTRRQMLQLAQAIQHRPTRAMVRKLWYSGKRYTELAGATVDAARQTITMPTTKNGDPDVQPIHPKVRSAYKVPAPEYFSARYYVAQARQAIGLPANMTIHKLRHGTATAILQHGGTLSDVQATLNHRSPASAMRYAHVMLDVKRAATANIGRKVA